MSLLYKEIANKILNLIEQTPNITRLPTERELALSYNASRQTIRNAITFLEEKGIIVKRQGSGIYLSPSYLKQINHAAIIVPNSEDYIYPKLINELEKLYQSINYSFDVYSSYNSLNEEGKILTELINHPVSTLLVNLERNALPSPFADKYKTLKSKGTNIIFIGNPNPNLTDYSYIKFDDFYSGYCIGKRINYKEKNWCGIFVNDNRGSIDRYYGFIQCMEDNKYSYNEEYIHWISSRDVLDIRNGKTKCLIDIISKYKTIPNIFICSNDDIAYGIIMHLKNIKELSEEISFFSFDNSYIHNISEKQIYSYNGDKNMLYSKIIELTLLGAKNKKEVITLPSTLNT